ncbi:MAG: type II secretion system F family protein [Bryobacterales bacterium]|nr:type II secretion system F family protein [Bryobacterales bacterium]
MLPLVAFLIFSGALFGAAWYVYSVPRQDDARMLSARLREIRVRSGGAARARGVSDLMIQEQRGTFAAVGDFLVWLGPARRLQEYIEQANLKYKSSRRTYAMHRHRRRRIPAAQPARHEPHGATHARVIGPRLVAHLLHPPRPRQASDQVRRESPGRHRSLQSLHEGRPQHPFRPGDALLETTDPVRMEFKKVVEELALGSQLEAALHGLGRRVPIIDLKFFVTGLILQRQTGANMVTVLENLSILIRERLNLAAKMKAATTQQRFSAGLLCILPLVVGLGFWVVKPEYIRLLYTDETGSKFLTYAIVSELVGILVIRQISRPRL